MNEQYIDTIHRYLTGTLEAAEHAAFEEELKTNATLRSDVELEHVLLAGIDKAGEAQLRTNIGAVHQQLKADGFFESAGQEAPLRVSYLSGSTRIKQFIAIAASLVVVAGAVWFFIQNGSTRNDAIFANHYQPAEDLQRAQTIVTRLKSTGFGGVNTQPDSLRLALQAYEAGQYDEALALLTALGAAYPQNDTVQYFTGVVHISHERYAKAIEVLLPLSRSDTSALRNDALWNLGLCYLKMENGERDARGVFTQLSQDNAYPKQRGAKAVLDQLLPEQ